MHYYDLHGGGLLTNASLALYHTTSKIQLTLNIIIMMIMLLLLIDIIVI